MAAMFAQFYLVILNAALCHCSAEFEMFPGFELELSESTLFYTTETTNVTQATSTTVQIPMATESNFNCTENEKPLNLGAYEVPTERDLVLFVRKTLTQKFRSYNRKALFFLNDMKEATKAASLLANKCVGYQDKYRICLKGVKHHYEIITKKLMTAVEEHKRNMTFFTEAQVCNMAEIANDPLVLIKILAEEEVTLKFALPAFLRLLGDCQIYCKRDFTTTQAKKPTRRLSDQQFLVKHILATPTLNTLN